MKSKAEIFLIILILILAFAVRIWKINTSPAGFYTDESSIGYNAWSLLETGRDEHNKPWPLFFEAYGEWKLPVYIYSVLVTQVFLGPKDITIRLPAVLYGTFSVLMIYLFTRELLRVKVKKLPSLYWLPYFASFLLAINPWHYQFSRPGFEASSALFFVLMGLWLFVYAANRKDLFYLVFSVLSFVVSLYAYSSCRLVTPVIGILLFVFYIRKFPVWYWLVILVIGGAAVFPFARWAVSGAGMVRMQMVSIFSQHDIKDPWLLLFNNYLKNISPKYIFLVGDPTIASGSEVRWGLHYLVELPFFFLGLSLVIFKRYKEFFLMFLLLVLGFVPPSIAMGNPHALRGFLALPGTVFFSSLGFVWLWGLIKNSFFKDMILSMYLSMLVVYLVIFFYAYKLHLPAASHDWQVDYRVEAKEILAIQNNYRKIFFQNGFHETAFLWELRIEPREYITAQRRDVLSKYVFGVKSLDDVPKTGGNLYITFDENQQAQLVKHVYLHGKRIASIWKV